MFHLHKISNIIQMYINCVLEIHFSLVNFYMDVMHSGSGGV
jgi:hypothetical protein